MNEKTRLRALLAGSAAAAVISAAIRILITLTAYDSYYNVYEFGTPLPTVYHILLLVMLAGICVCAYLFAPKRDVEAPLAMSDAAVFFSILTGFMFAANALLSLLNIARGASPALLGILDIVFAVLSVLYFLGLTRKAVKPAAMAILSVAPIAWFSVTLIQIYFDNSVIHSSPAKTIAEIAMLAAMIALLGESRSHLGILGDRFHAIVSLGAPILLLTHALPAIILPGRLLTAYSDSYLHVIIEAAIAFFLWARYAGILTAAKPAEEAPAPDTSDETTEA